MINNKDVLNLWLLYHNNCKTQDFLFMEQNGLKKSEKICYNISN